MITIHNRNLQKSDIHNILVLKPELMFTKLMYIHPHITEYKQGEQ